MRGPELAINMPLSLKKMLVLPLNKERRVARMKRRKQKRKWDMSYGAQKSDVPLETTKNPTWQISGCYLATSSSIV